MTFVGNRVFISLPAELCIYATSYATRIFIRFTSRSLSDYFLAIPLELCVYAANRATLFTFPADSLGSKRAIIGRKIRGRTGAREKNILRSIDAIITRSF